jgi:hypothetical protein
MQVPPFQFSWSTPAQPLVDSPPLVVVAEHAFQLSIVISTTGAFFLFATSDYSSVFSETATASSTGVAAAVQQVSLWELTGPQAGARENCWLSGVLPFHVDGDDGTVGDRTNARGIKVVLCFSSKYYGKYRLNMRHTILHRKLLWKRYFGKPNTT